MDRRPTDTPRRDVYAALDSERDYQDSRWNASTTTSEGRHSFSEWIAYMEDYLDEAKHILARFARQVGEPQVAQIIRKVTAMGVAAMEEHGAPQRDGFYRKPGTTLLIDEFFEQADACKALVASLIASGATGASHEVIEAVARENTWREAGTRLMQLG